jgi:hypothetical protein
MNIRRTRPFHSLTIGDTVVPAGARDFTVGGQAFQEFRWFLMSPDS